MTREIKKKELLSTQYKIERLKRESGFVRRNWLKTVLFGAALTVLGPSYTSEPDIHGRTRNALETSGATYLELSMGVAIFYSLAVIIAHIVWTRREKKKLIELEQREKIIKMELELFYK